MRVHLCLTGYNAIIPMYGENICSMRRMGMKLHGVFFRSAHGRPNSEYVSLVECIAFICKSREEEFLGVLLEAQKHGLRVKVTAAVAACLSIGLKKLCEMAHWYSLRTEDLRLRSVQKSVFFGVAKDN